MVLGTEKSKSVVPAPAWHLVRAFVLHPNMAESITSETSNLTSSFSFLFIPLMPP
jgi:hypothetical protein